MTPFTDIAEQVVRHEIAYLADRSAGSPLGYIQASVVSTYVAGHLSPIAYATMRRDGIPLPTGGQNAEIAELALASGAGLCGQASSAAMVLYDRLGAEARQLDIWHAQGGHTTVEVRYEDGWHWFDPIFATHYSDGGNVLGLLDVLRHPEPGGILVNGRAVRTQFLRQFGLILPVGADVTDLRDWRITPHNSPEVMACS